MATSVPADTVLLLIDVQVGFTRFVNKLQPFADYSVRKHPEQVMPNLVDFTGRWLDGGGAVVATRYQNPLQGSPLRHGYGVEYSRFTPGTELGEEQIRIDPRLQSVLSAAPSSKVDYVDKVEYSCASAEFVALAAERSWRRFLLGGFNTNICLLYSLNALFSLDAKPQLDPVVLEDISAAAGPIFHHNFACEQVKMCFGQHRLRTTDRWCEENLAPSVIRPRADGVAAVPPGPRLELEDPDGKWGRSVDGADAMRMFGLAPERA